MTGSSKVAQPIHPTSDSPAISYKEAPPPPEIFSSDDFRVRPNLSGQPEGGPSDSSYYHFAEGPGNRTGGPAIPSSPTHDSHQYTVYNLDPREALFTTWTLIRIDGSAPPGMPSISHSDVAPWTHLDGIEWTQSGGGAQDYSFRLDLFVNTLGIPDAGFPHSPAYMDIVPPGYDSSRHAIMYLAMRSLSFAYGPAGVLRYQAGTAFNPDEWWEDQNNAVLVGSAGTGFGVNAGVLLRPHDAFGSSFGSVGDTYDTDTLNVNYPVTSLDVNHDMHINVNWINGFSFGLGTLPLMSGISTLPHVAVELRNTPG